MIFKQQRNDNQAFLGKFVSRERDRGITRADGIWGSDWDFVPRGDIESTESWFSPCFKIHVCVLKSIFSLYQILHKNFKEIN